VSTDFDTTVAEVMADPVAQAAAERNRAERKRVTAAYQQWLRDTYRAGMEEFKPFEGGWRARDGEGPHQDLVDGILQLLSVLLAQKGPYTQTADDSYANPEITSWVDEARDVLHYALEGGLDDDYVQARLKELGGYVSPRELCSDCERRLTTEELAARNGYDDQLCDSCADPGSQP
jgi:hypothetical protein